MTQPTTPKNTNAFFLQSGLAFAIALLDMLFAIYYLPTTRGSARSSGSAPST